MCSRLGVKSNFNSFNNFYHLMEKAWKCDKMIFLQPNKITNFFFIFQALFSEASQILHGALDGRVYFKDVTLVIPSSWRDVKCKIQIHPPRGTSTFGVKNLSVCSLIFSLHPFLTIRRISPIIGVTLNLCLTNSPT